MNILTIVHLKIIEITTMGHQMKARKEDNMSSTSALDVVKTVSCIINTINIFNIKCKNEVTPRRDVNTLEREVHC